MKIHITNIYIYMFLYADCTYMVLVSLRSRELICGYGSAHSEGGGGGFFSNFFFSKFVVSVDLVKKTYKTHQGEKW